MNAIQTFLANQWIKEFNRVNGANGESSNTGPRSISHEGGRFVIKSTYDTTRLTQQELIDSITRLQSRPDFKP